jgi:uroporphyrinogen decarboxylase
MNARERFLATAHYQSRDRLFHNEMGPFPETLARWRQEGLPPDSDWEYYGGYDRLELAPLNPHLCPVFAYQTLALEGDYEVYRDTDGVTKRQFRHASPAGMPQYLDYPLHGRAEWPQLRQRLDPASPARLPVIWDSLRHTYQHRDFALGVNSGSLYGWLRSWMGLEGVSLALYDDRAFIETAAAEITEFLLAYLDRVLAGVQYDYAVFWEDMAGKNGSLIDPVLYRSLFARHYRRLTDRLHAAGIEIIMLDSDGRVDELIPIWLDLGINWIYPMEVAAGNDVVHLRRRFGRDLRLAGGMDKRVLAGPRAGIRAMVEERVPLLRAGGYVPGCDHAMPPDIPWENYLYYRQLLRSIAP